MIFFLLAPVGTAIAYISARLIIMKIHKIQMTDAHSPRRMIKSKGDCQSISS